MKEEALEDKAKAEAKIKDEGKKATKIKKTNEKSRKKVDKITGEYNGKKYIPILKEVNIILIPTEKTYIQD